MHWTKNPTSFQDTQMDNLEDALGNLQKGIFFFSERKLRPPVMTGLNLCCNKDKCIVREWALN